MRLLSLFAGIGGFDVGFERAGMTCVGQVEIDKNARAVLAAHWPDVKRMEDIKDVKGDEFGTVDIICGGFPCQDASMVRRLTPLECERLQGFPDDWTKINKHTADSPRYKQCGNSVSVPVAEWIGERIMSFNNRRRA